MNPYFHLFNNIHKPLVRCVISTSFRNGMMKNKRNFLVLMLLAVEWKTDVKQMITPMNVYLTSCGSSGKKGV